MRQNKFTLKFTRKAYGDLDEIYGYISRELYNEDAASNHLNKIEASIMRLRDFPFSCNYVRDETLKSKGYRKLIVENYIVFHLVNEAEREVVVMRVLYGKKNYQDFI